MLSSTTVWRRAVPGWRAVRPLGTTKAKEGTAFERRLAKREKRGPVFVPKQDRLAYKAAVHALRQQWVAETKERLKSNEEELEAQRKRVLEEKAERKRLKRIQAEANIVAHEKRTAEAAELYRHRIENTIELKDRRYKARLENQRRLVATLEEEAKTWLSSEAKVDEAITEEFFHEPGSTGLVTRQSHNWWRYSHDATEELGGTSIEELDLPADADARMKNSTNTELLIKTQSRSLREFHDYLVDAPSIANAIKGLMIEEEKPIPRGFGDDGPPGRSSAGSPFDPLGQQGRPGFDWQRQQPLPGGGMLQGADPRGPMLPGDLPQDVAAGLPGGQRGPVTEDADLDLEDGGDGDGGDDSR